MSKYQEAYEKLKKDYRLITKNHHSLNHYSPIKKVRVLSSIHGIPSVTFTKMHGIAVDGYIVDKTICVNDETCTTDDDVILEDSYKHVLERFHNVGLTRLRCGLMTCVALEEALSLEKITEVHSIGFIGCGKTNIQNAECIKDIFGYSNFVIRGSARNRAKNLEEFKKIASQVLVDDTKDCSILNKCDVIITCTSTCNIEDQITTTLLSYPKVFIALDTGYLLDESFRRECECYSDDIDQLNKYYHEEFIFDQNHYHLKQLMRDTNIEKERICVYMFGISFADAEVAEMVYNHEISTNDLSEEKDVTK